MRTARNVSLGILVTLLLVFPGEHMAQASDYCDYPGVNPHYYSNGTTDCQTAEANCFIYWNEPETVCMNACGDICHITSGVMPIKCNVDDLGGGTCSYEAECRCGTDQER